MSASNMNTIKMAFVVGVPPDDTMDIVDILAVKRICPGYFLIKVDENTTTIPKEAGDAITEEHIEKLLAQHYLWYTK